MGRNTVAKINLTALHANLDLLIGMAGTSKTIAVVKANAYGNGAVAVAKSIEKKVDLLAVAFLTEALELRDAGITKTILILQGPHDTSELYVAEPKGLETDNFIWMLHSEWQLQAYAQCKASEASTHNDAWLKFDTGMHRLGLPMVEFSHLLAKYSSIINNKTVLVTHLANADEPIQEHAVAQIETFLEAVSDANLPLCIANSASSIRFKKARADYVRLGIAMYGSTPFQAHDNPIQLSPVMTLESQIIALRTIPKGDTVGYGGTWRASQTSLIATVSLGYADGYPRHAPINTPAWYKGALISLVGRVSMDMLTFDVTGIPNVAIGDTVQLWGNELPINDVASHIGTIGYELMTRVSQRVPRAFVK